MTHPLVQHIDRTKQQLVYTDFEDELGTGAAVDLPQIGAVDFNRFKRKARRGGAGTTKT